MTRIELNSETREAYELRPASPISCWKDFARQWGLHSLKFHNLQLCLQPVMDQSRCVAESNGVRATNSAVTLLLVALAITFLSGITACGDSRVTGNTPLTSNKPSKADICGLLNQTEVSKASLQDPKNNSTSLPFKELTDEDVKKIEKEHACLRAYSSGFPGGEEAFLKADATELRHDLDVVEQLFQNSSSITKTQLLDKSDPQRERNAHIYLGWDREQVLLWGNFFYIWRLFNDEDFDGVVNEADRVRKTFGLNVRPLETWDRAEEATYYSPQTLRNLIAILEYQAKSRLEHGTEEAKSLAESYFIDYPALAPLLALPYGSPTKRVLGPYCGSSPSGP